MRLISPGDAREDASPHTHIQSVPSRKGKKKKEKRNDWEGKCISSRSLSTCRHFPPEQTLHNQCSVAVLRCRMARFAAASSRGTSSFCSGAREGKRESSTQMYPINTCPDGSLALSPSRSHISHLHILSASLICNRHRNRSDLSRP